MKIALIHDYLDHWGGAELVFSALVELFPEASVFSLTYDKEKMKDFLPLKNVITSAINNFPKFLKKRKRYLLPIMPTLPETFDLKEFDVVISSSGAFSKGIVVKPGTIHICYCHTPMRFAWDWHLEYKKEQKKGMLTNIAIGILTNYLRIWDFSNSQRVDYFIANSQNVANRIKKYYRRESTVIYPFANVSKECQKNSEFISVCRDLHLPENYFLIISQLAPCKRIDLAIEAFNKLELPLVIAGDGKDKKRLKRMAGSNVKILGFVPEETRLNLLKNCEALIFPGEDDFGITMAEAAMMGKPVLAYRGGGAPEIVKEGITGEFFDYPAAEVLAEGVKRIRENISKYNGAVIKKEAEKFSKERFLREFMEYFNLVTCNL